MINGTKQRELRRTWLVDEIIPVEPLLQGACQTARRQVMLVFNGTIQVCRSAADLADERLSVDYVDWAARRLLTRSKYELFKDRFPRGADAWRRLFELMIERVQPPLPKWLEPEPPAPEPFSVQCWER